MLSKLKRFVTRKPLLLSRDSGNAVVSAAPDSAPSETTADVVKACEQVRDLLGGPRSGLTFQDMEAADLGRRRNSAMCISAVYRCVKLLSESVATLPIQYQRDRGDGVFAEFRDPVFTPLLNIEPDGCCSAFDFWRDVTMYVLLRGNAYLVPIYDPTDGTLISMPLCNPDCVAYNNALQMYAISDPEAGVNGVFAARDVIHIKGLPSITDRHQGVSVITYARQAIDIAGVAQNETRARFANGGSVRGIIANDSSLQGYGKYSDDELNKQAESLEEKFRAGGWIVSTSGDVNFRQISMSAADMQFLESRKFTVIEICRFFGVDPSFVFENTSNNYKSAEMSNVSFLSQTLNPLLCSIENELTRKLIDRTAWPWRRFRFDRFGIYACDLDSRVRYQTNTISNGTRTINDWRRVEGRPPVEGGDIPLISANLRKLNEITNGDQSDTDANTDTDHAEA